VFDLCVLTVLIQWSGNTENPFVLFYVFHIGIVAMLLPCPKAFLLGAAARAVRSGAVLIELAGIVSHHPLHLGKHLRSRSMECPCDTVLQRVGLQCVGL